MEKFCKSDSKTIIICSWELLERYWELIYLCMIVQHHENLKKITKKTQQDCVGQLIDMTAIQKFMTCHGKIRKPIV